MDEHSQHTVNGLLRKREELLCENNELRERMAILTNDVEAIDRAYSTPSATRASL